MKRLFIILMCCVCGIYSAYADTPQSVAEKCNGKEGIPDTDFLSWNDYCKYWSGYCAMEVYGYNPTCFCGNRNGIQYIWVDGAGCVKPTKVSCKDGRRTQIGKACCDTGSRGIYNKQDDVCVCVSDAEHLYKFEINNGKGECVPVIVEDEPLCPDNATQVGNTCVCQDECDIYDYSEHKCITDNECTKCKSITDAIYIDSYNEKVCACVNGKKFNDTRTACEDIQIVQNIVTDVSDEVKVEMAELKIRTLVSELSAIESKLTKSHWKNASGGFNTARLASDSIAGVVLGTAGGLITSSVIKKNQTKSGFENMKCTINGQNVASYGDEFMVGVQQ